MLPGKDNGGEEGDFPIKENERKLWKNRKNECSCVTDTMQAPCGQQLIQVKLCNYVRVLLFRGYLLYDDFS